MVSDDNNFFFFLYYFLVNRSLACGNDQTDTGFANTDIGVRQPSSGNEKK